MRKTVSDGSRKLEILGTSHVSEESRREVEETIEELQPDLIAVELDQNRLDSLRNDSGWRELDVAEAVREGKGYQLALNLFLSVLQRKIGGDLRPGREMLAAVEAAEKKDIEYRLVDRDINETFSSLRDQLGFFAKMRLLSAVLERTEEFEEEDLTDQDVVQKLVEELQERHPVLNKVFLEERNAYMAEEIRKNEFDDCLAVVGAAHVEGLADQFEDPQEVPPPGRNLPLFKIVTYGIPALVLLGIPYIFWQFGTTQGIQASAIWVLLNGFLSAAGAILARSHPLTWVASFIAAPFTSLYPALGAGMVAPYVEAKLRPPSVGDLEDVAEIDRYRELWDNQAGVIILTFVLVTAGSVLASLIAGSAIISMLF